MDQEWTLTTCSLQPVILQTRKLRPREIKVIPLGNYGYLEIEIRLEYGI